MVGISVGLNIGSRLGGILGDVVDLVAMTPTSTSTLDYGDGASITLSAARDVYTFADGSFGVSSVGSDVVITADAPASIDDASGYRMHGMQDALQLVTTTSGEQGLDEVGGLSSGVAKPTYAIPFSSGLNIAPSATAANYTMATADGTGAAVKAVRRITLALDGSDIENAALLERVIVVTAINHTPNVGEIRPPMIGTIPESLNIADANFARVAAFTLPALPNTLADCLAYVQSPQLTNHSEGESRRAFAVGTDYARDIIRDYLAPAALYMMHSSTSDANREAFLAAFMVRATDAYGAYVAGQRMFGGAGQVMADDFCLALVAALCPSKSFLRTQSALRRSNLNDQTQWADPANTGDGGVIDTIVGAGSATSFNRQPQLPEHEGYPLWTSDTVLYDPNGISDENTLPTARYNDISFGMAFAGTAVLGLVTDGLETIYGAQGTWNTSNNPYATLGRLDLYLTVNDTPVFYTAANRAPDYALPIWADRRSSFGAAPVAMPPIQLDLQDYVTDGLVTETASGINYDYAGITDDGRDWAGSILPITSREMRLSHDGVQFGAPVAAAASGSLAFTGERYWQERRTNSEGASPWSVNHSFFNGTTAPDRGVLSGGTIPTAAPVNAELPKLYEYRYDESAEYPLYDEVTGTFGTSKATLIAGAGLWSDGIASATYQWQEREGVGAASDIVGETSKVLLRPTDILSTSLVTKSARCVVTVDDGNGNTTVAESAWLQMPEIATQSDDFATELAGSTAFSGVTLAYQSGDESYRVTLNETDFGYGAFPLTGLIKGVTYTAQAVISAKNGTGQLDLRALDSDLNAIVTSADRLSAAGTVEIEFVADGGIIYISPRWRGVAPAGAYFDVTSVAALAPAVGPVTAFSDDFTSDTSANYASNDGTLTYDGTNDELIVDPNATFRGVGTGAISVTIGTEYVANMTLRNDFPIGGSTSEIEGYVGTTQFGQEVAGSGKLGEQLAPHSVALTFTPTTSTIYLYARVRLDDPAGTFSVLDWSVAET